MFGYVRALIENTKLEVSARVMRVKSILIVRGGPYLVSGSVRTMVEDTKHEVDFCCVICKRHSGGSGCIKRKYLDLFRRWLRTQHFKLIFVVGIFHKTCLDLFGRLAEDTKLKANFCCDVGKWHSDSSGCPIGSVWICPDIDKTQNSR